MYLNTMPLFSVVVVVFLLRLVILFKMWNSAKAYDKASPESAHGGTQVKGRRELDADCRSHLWGSLVPKRKTALQTAQEPCAHALLLALSTMHLFDLRLLRIKSRCVLCERKFPCLAESLIPKCPFKPSWKAGDRSFYLEANFWVLRSSSWNY